MKAQRRIFEEEIARQRASDGDFLAYFESRRQEQQQVVDNLGIGLRQDRNGSRAQMTREEAERAKHSAKSNVLARSKADPFGLDSLKAKADQLMKEADLRLSQRASRSGGQ